MSHLHVPQSLGRVGRFFLESDPLAWGVIAIAVGATVLIGAAFLLQ